MIKDFLLDLIFPRFCLGCQKELNLKQASFICETCFDKIILNGIECHICGLRNDVGACHNCRKYTFLNGIWSAGKYEDPILREAIHQFKYKSIESLKKPLAELIIKYLEKEKIIKNHLCPTPDNWCRTQGLAHESVLAPIPLTWQRKLNRGFNQSELLARELSQVLNCPVVNLLKRQKFSAPQARIQNWKERKENIAGAFVINFSALPLSTTYPLSTRCRTPSKLDGIRKVVLVDDVSTSGATLEEAAKVLKQAGIKEVYGLVVAKG